MHPVLGYGAGSGVKGAAVGGVAGHFAGHHGVLGAGSSHEARGPNVAPQTARHTARPHGRGW